MHSYAQDLNKEKAVVWVDPAHDPKASSQTIVVWFENQFLEKGDSFDDKVKSFRGKSRGQVRGEVIAALIKMSNESFEEVQSKLQELESAKLVSDVRKHWIINGFTCTVTKEGFKDIKSLSGIDKIFIKRMRNATQGVNMGPEYLKDIPSRSFDHKIVDSIPWNIEKIRAQEVWNEFGITGSGTLNIVHDSGFKLDIPPLAETIYTNSKEIPGNGIDDDQNGYIDDYHGFNFDTRNANLNEPNIRRGSNIHGNLCAAVVVGTYATETKQAIGIAPGSTWSPIIGSSNIEEAVEWAIEQGAHTYSMSFSHPNLGEYKTHWRKVLEHGTFCGTVFISGAGNFARGPRAAPIPVQMRNPEDIPNAVIAVAGVGKNGKRPEFSSQGPVEWNTEHYKDGTVKKPDFSTLNFQIPCVDPEGRLKNSANGNSLASPHMAGIVSLMLSADPDLLPWEVRDILIATAKDIGEEGFDYQTGHGFVNAYDAVKAVIKR